MKTQILKHKSLYTTQDAAVSLAEEGAPEGTVVVADIQAGGRGRLGRAWQSPAGGLWFSIILRPKVPARDVSRLTLVIAVGLAEAIRREAGVAALIKWPNDIVVGKRKLAGILTEMKTAGEAVDYAVVGIGVNVNNEIDGISPEAQYPPTSLKAETGADWDIQRLLDAFLKRIILCYQGFPTMMPDLMTKWNGLAAAVGKRVAIDAGSETLTGVAAGVDPSGALVVRDEAGRARTVTAGVLRVLDD